MLEEAAEPSYHSTTYGINNRCALNILKYFHVCNFGLPPDVMHDLLEGYVPYTMKQMLNRLLNEKLFTLEHLNNIISHFNYGNDMRNKPNVLTSKVLSSEDHSLNQSGMYTYSYHTSVYLFSCGTLTNIIIPLLCSFSDVDTL